MSTDLHELALELARKVYPDYSNDILEQIAREIEGVSEAIIRSESAEDTAALISKYVKQYGISIPKDVSGALCTYCYARCSPCSTNATTKDAPSTTANRSPITTPA